MSSDALPIGANPERRGLPRVAIDVGIVFLCDSQGMWMMGRLVNVSPRGLFVSLHGPPLEVGEQVRVKFGPHRRPAITLEGRVVRFVDQDARPDGQSRGNGVALTRLSRRWTELCARGAERR